MMLAFTVAIPVPLIVITGIAILILISGYFHAKWDRKNDIRMEIEEQKEQRKKREELEIELTPEWIKAYDTCRNHDNRYAYREMWLKAWLTQMNDMERALLPKLSSSAAEQFTEMVSGIDRSTVAATLLRLAPFLTIQQPQKIAEKENPTKKLDLTKQLAQAQRKLGITTITKEQLECKHVWKGNNIACDKCSIHWKEVFLLMTATTPPPHEDNPEIPCHHMWQFSGGDYKCNKCGVEPPKWQMRQAIKEQYETNTTKRSN